MKLIIAEKRSLAESIVNALGGDSFKLDHSAQFYENSDYIVSWAMSHLFELSQDCLHKAQATEEFFSSAVMTDGFCPDCLEFIPVESQSAPLPHIHQFETLQNLMAQDDVDEVIHAGDVDPDGEIVIRTILHEAKCIKPVTRLFTSDFTPDSILSALRYRRPLDIYDAFARKGYFNMYSNLLNGKRYVHLGLSEEENESFGKPLMR